MGGRQEAEACKGMYIAESGVGHSLALDAFDDQAIFDVTLLLYI